LTACLFIVITTEPEEQSMIDLSLLFKGLAQKLNSPTVFALIVQKNYILI